MTAQTRYARAALASLAMLVGLAACRPAFAQAPVARPRRPPSELVVSAHWVAPLDLGTSQSNLTRGDGGPVRFLETENSLGPALGVDALVAIPVTRAVAIGVRGGWLRGDLRTRIFGDFENIPSIEPTALLSRFTAGGSIVWTVRPDRRASLFVEGGAGWMRELAGGSVLAADGAVAHVGLGVKYWWAERPLGPPARAGFRLEGRVNVRSKGISLGDHDIGAAPAVLAGLIFRL